MHTKEGRTGRNGRNGGRQNLKQRRLEARLERVLDALYSGKVEREQKLPGLSDSESQVFWFGWGCAREHTARVLGSISATIGDASFAPGLRPGQRLPWEQAPA